MTLDLVRYVGIGMAIAGAAITAGAGIQLFVAAVAAWIRKAAKHVARWTMKWALRIWDKIRRKHTVTASRNLRYASDVAKADDMVTVGEGQSVAKTVEEQVLALRRELADVRAEHARELTAERKEREKALKDLRALIDERVGELLARVGLIERRSAQLDGSGLLPIAMGIVFTAIPDVISEWPAGLAWTVVVAAPAVTLLLLIQSVRELRRLALS